MSTEDGLRSATTVPQEAGGAHRSIETVSRDEKILAGLGVLLVLDLLLLPWYVITVTAGGVSVSISDTATGSPDGWLGVLALLVVVALLVDVVIERLSPHMQVPAIGRSRATTRYALAVVAVALLALKLLIHLGSAGGLGFWGAFVLGGGLVWVTYRLRELEAARG
jgi:hypothetical protein